MLPTTLTIRLPRLAAALPLASLLAATSPFQARAADWIASGDEAFRTHLETIADTGDTNMLTTTWPVATESLPRLLDYLDPESLSSGEQYAFARLSDQLSSDHNIRLSGQLGASRQELRGFANDFRHEDELQLSLAGDWAKLSGKLSVNLYNPHGDTDSIRLDGSYLALDIGDWQIGAGQIDRWWGPGWQTSLILSHNAKPAPGLFLRRNTTKPSDLPILKLLGPWLLDLFANQLEHDRHIPEAKLLGARFTFKPLNSLEIGLSRTAQWAGEGRPSSLSNLWKLILGHDNRGSDGIDLDGSNEPGNQLGGVDWRWTFKAFGAPLAFYGQLIGEDEAGGLPSREIGMIGLEAPIHTEFSHGRVFLEASDTTMNFLNNPMPNSAYNHSIYRSGYRYYGDPIGASHDNDSETVTLGGYHEFGDDTRHAVNWKIIYASLNKDGSPGRNEIAPESIETAMLSGGYQNELSENLSLGFSAYLLIDDIAPNTGFLRKGIQVSMTFRK